MRQCALCLLDAGWRSGLKGRGRRAQGTVRQALGCTPTYPALPSVALAKKGLPSLQETRPRKARFPGNQSIIVSLCVVFSTGSGVKAATCCAPTFAKKIPANCGTLHPTRPDRRSLQEPQGRSEHPPDLSSTRRAHRSPHLHFVSGLLPARHLASAPEGSGSRTHAAGRPREVLRHADDRRPLPTDDGRTVMLSRYTQPEKELQMLIEALSLELPGQPPPRITATAELAG